LDRSHKYCYNSSIFLHTYGRTLRVFENRVLRRIFGPKREEVVGGWRRLHNEELHNLYTSLNIVKAIKSMRVRWVGHVGCGSVDWVHLTQEKNQWQALMNKVMNIHAPKKSGSFLTS
jgi:hypothetical protein